MPNTMRVGDRLNTYDEIYLLPPGTSVGEGTTQHWVKQADGQWITNRGRGPYPTEDAIALGAHRVLAYPEGYTPDEKPTKTLHQWKHWFRDGSLAAQERHGVSYSSVEECMQSLGCGASEFPPGPGMVITCSRDRERLPDGTVAYVGSPENVGTFGMAVRRAGSWVEVLGHGSLLGTSRALTIESVPGTDEVAWLTEQATEETEEEIAAFRRRAWLAAVKLQQQHRWCGTFNNIASGLGLSADIMRVDAVNGIGVGARVNPEQAATLPVGSVLRWVHHNLPRTAWFIRAEGMSNRAGTRRVFGYQEADGRIESLVSTANLAPTMEVMHLTDANGVGVMALDVDIASTYDLLPVGTKLQYADQTTDWYIIAQDRRLAGSAYQYTTPPVRGSYGIHDFTRPENLRVTEFGAPS